MLVVLLHIALYYAQAAPQHSFCSFVCLLSIIIIICLVVQYPFLFYYYFSYTHTYYIGLSTEKYNKSALMLWLTDCVFTRKKFFLYIIFTECLQAKFAFLVVVLELPLVVMLQVIY